MVNEADEAAAAEDEWDEGDDGVGGRGEASPRSTAQCAIKLELLSGLMLPKAAEQRCTPELWDRYCPPSKQTFGSVRLRRDSHRAALTPPR
eukprot:6783404-Prymnesium_polylepis.1